MAGFGGSTGVSKGYVDGAIAQSTANTAKSAFQSWGTTITANGFHHGLFLDGVNVAYLVWFPSTTTIAVRSLRNGTFTKSSTSGTIQFNEDGDGTDITITRNGDTITVSVSSNATMSLIYT